MNEENFGIVRIKDPIKPVQRSMMRFFGKIFKPEEDKSFFDRYGARVHKHGEKSIADSGTSSDSMAIYRPSGSQAIPASKAMDSHFGWVYACVKAISDEMANIQYKMFTINKEGEHEELLEHEMLDLLEGVNESQTGPEFRKLLSSHLEITGNAYVYLFGVKNFNDKPKALYLLNPGKTKLVMNRTIYPYKIAHYEMYDNNRKFIFQPHEIIHFKYADPNNQEMGLGTVGGAAEWIDNDNYAMEFNRNFFKNGARMSGVFETDITSIEQTQRLKLSFEEQFAGVKNAWKSMIMPKGVKWVPTQVTSKDMDFNKLLDMTAQRILAAFRVSKTILGTAESDTNRATAETADYVFAKRTIKPKMEMIVSTFNEFLAPRYDDNIYLGFNDPVPEDKAARKDEMVAAVGGKQVITQNEARQEFMGLGPVEEPGADEITGGSDDDSIDKPENNELQGESGEGKSARHKTIAVKTIKKQRAKKGSVKFKTQFSRNAKIRQSMASELAQKIASFMTETKKKNVVEMSDEEYLAVIYTNSKAKIDDYEPKIREVMKSVSERQEKVVLKNLPNAIKSSKALVPSKLFDMKEWIAITVSALDPVVMQFFNAEFNAAAQAVGTPEAQISEHIKETLAARMQLLGESYNQTIMDTLTLKLNEGLSQGFSRAELAQSVKDIYAWSKDYQAKTETVAISNMANKAAWQAGGRVQTVRWYTSEKDNVCPFCNAMKGTEIDINQNFLDYGQEFTGTNGETMTANYSAVGGPPLHPNCGCLLRPASWKPLGASASHSHEKTDVDEALKAIKDLEHES